VAEGRVEQDLDQLFSFSEFMVYRGIKPGSRVITAEKQRIDDRQSALLHYLGLRPGDEVIFVRRLRLGGDQPLVIANTWLPAARFPRFLKQDLAHQSIYDLMEATGSRPTDAVQTIEATTLAPEEATLLTVPAGSAALLVRRVGYAKGVPVEYAVDYYRGDRTTFRVRLGVLEQRLSEPDPPRAHLDLIAPRAPSGRRAAVARVPSSGHPAARVTFSSRGEYLMPIGSRGEFPSAGAPLDIGRAFRQAGRLSIQDARPIEGCAGRMPCTRVSPGPRGDA